MHPLAARVVRQALAAGACIDPVEHFAALAELDAAARQTQDSPLWHVADLLDRPVIVGDPDSKSGHPAVLYTPSYASLRLINDILSGWFDDHVMGNLSIAWALSMARDPAGIRTAASPRELRRMVVKWADGLNCTLAALFEVMQGLMSVKGSSSGKASGDGRSQERMVLARIVHEMGGDEDYWLFGPRERLDAAMQLLRRKDEAEANAIAKAQGKSAAREPDSPEVIAFNQWRKASADFLLRFTPCQKT